MKYKIVVMRDRAADAYSVPQFVSSLGAAVRSFSDAVNAKRADDALCQHPEDFDLFDVGEFDDSDGLFYTYTPRQIAVGKDQVR